MKKIIFSLSLVAMSLASFAQSDAYKSTMQGLIMKMNAAQDAEALTSVQNGFNRISLTETKEWLPKYYMAYSIIMKAIMSKETFGVDGLLDEADVKLKEALAINPKSDEILVLQSLSNSARINVDPMSRGMKFGSIAAGLLEQALEINPNNPRIYFLQGQSKFYTPEAFGGSKEKAASMFKTALEKYSTFKYENDLMPNWGKEQCEKMLALAQKK